MRHCGLRQEVACWFQSGKTQLISTDRSSKAGAIDVKKSGSVFYVKITFQDAGVSSKLDWDSYIISIAKTASKKIGALIRSMKFLWSLEVALYLYISTIQPWMEYCFHIWAGAPASLEPLAHRRHVARLSLFYKYYFRRCSSELAELAPLPYFQGRSTCYSDSWHDFSVTIPRFYKDVYVNSFFPRTDSGILCL